MARTKKGGKGTSDEVVEKKEKLSLSKRAGIQFPAARMLSRMKKERVGNRVSPSAAVFLASIMEYLTAEVLELAGNAARDHKRKRISPRHLFLAIRSDDELDIMLRGVTISGGGVMPSINAALLPKKKGKAQKEMDDGG